jgi:hypothetical protein
MEAGELVEEDLTVAVVLMAADTKQNEGAVVSLCWTDDRAALSEDAG